MGHVSPYHERKKEDETMQTERIIDLQAYFSRQREQNAEEERSCRRDRILWGIQWAVESASAAVIALCVVVCTLVFFTML